MESSNSALLISPSQRLSSTDIYNCSYKRHTPSSHCLANDFEKNEATLVADGAVQSTRLFRNNMRMLQRRNLRSSKVSPTTAATTVAATVMKSEIPRFALMKVYEEEEEEVTEMKKEGGNEDLVESPSSNNWLSREAFSQVNLFGNDFLYVILNKRKYEMYRFDLSSAVMVIHCPRSIQNLRP